MRLLRGAHQKEFQVLGRESPNGFYLPVASHGLYRAQTSLFRHHNMPGRGDARWHIKRPFLLVMADRLVAVKIKPVGHLPLYVEAGHWIAGRHTKFRQPLVDRPRRLRPINGRRRRPQQKCHRQNGWDQSDKVQNPDAFAPDHQQNHYGDERARYRHSDLQGRRRS